MFCQVLVHLVLTPILVDKHLFLRTEICIYCLNKWFLLSHVRFGGSERPLTGLVLLRCSAGTDDGMRRRLGSCVGAQGGLGAGGARQKRRMDEGAACRDIRGPGMRT